MDSDHGHILLFVGRVLKALAAGVVMLCSPPVRMLLWGLKAIFRVLTLPIRIPWRVGMWCWEATMALVEEYRHFLLYLTCAIAIGTVSGLLAATLTNLTVTWLTWLFPFLRPRHHPRRRLQKPTAAIPTKPSRPQPRHAASSSSAIYWSSDESVDNDADQDRRPVAFIPPSRRHGYAPKKPPPAAAAAAAAAQAGPSAWSSSSRASRHRAQPSSGKARVAVADTIHEESSGSEHELR
ncbi:uncharacterized protein B0H64DRAFT_126114 [Chaetomium fimeti]|uniref:Uncharacterized protein n=1 Tax=Chaetomium fimeti TaxID=1854472 RepID=A0AAE0HJA0_9PEZI|nr:hypothetical protein B0H64DRAFT_126114 [Chaetomium fimeti]